MLVIRIFDSLYGPVKNGCLFHKPKSTDKGYNYYKPSTRIIRNQQPIIPGHKPVKYLSWIYVTARCFLNIFRNMHGSHLTEAVYTNVTAIYIINKNEKRITWTQPILKKFSKCIEKTKTWWLYYSSYRFIDSSCGVDKFLMRPTTLS